MLNSTNYIKRVDKKIEKYLARYHKLNNKLFYMKFLKTEEERLFEDYDLKNFLEKKREQITKSKIEKNITRTIVLGLEIQKKLEEDKLNEKTKQKLQTRLELIKINLQEWLKNHSEKKLNKEFISDIQTFLIDSSTLAVLVAFSYALMGQLSVVSKILIGSIAGLFSAKILEIKKIREEIKNLQIDLFKKKIAANVEQPTSINEINYN